MSEGHENSQTEWNKKTEYYATGSRKGPIMIWSTPYHSPHVKWRLYGHESKVTKLVWCANASLEINPKHNQYLASASDDKTIRIWDVELETCQHVFRQHTDEIVALEFCRNGAFLASASTDKFVYIWKVGSEKELKSADTLVHKFEAPVQLLSLNWNNGGDRISVAGNDGFLTILELAGSCSISY